MPPNANLPSKILVVDNDEGVINSITHALESYKIQVVPAKDWQSALYLYNHHKLDLCIVSLELEEMPGGALIQKWRNHEIGAKRDVAMILCTGMKRKSGDTALMKELGDIILLSKPIQTPALLSAMANAMGVSKERVKVNEIKEKLLTPLLEQQKVDKALQIVLEQLEPLGERGLFHSAKFHVDIHKENDAISKLKKLLERDPHNMSYHNELGRIYLQQGKLTEAQKSYEKADSVAPQNIDRLNDMAELYLQLKMPDKSIEKFKEIIKLTPEDQEVKYGMYEKIYNAGFVNEAQEFCRETTTPKELVRHFNNRGVMYSKKEEYIHAIDEYKKAIKYIPGSKELHRVLYNMAISHINLKTIEHLREAHKLLEESLKLEPSYDKAREKLKITAKYAKETDAKPSTAKKKNAS